MKNYSVAVFCWKWTSVVKIKMIIDALHDFLSSCIAGLKKKNEMIIKKIWHSGMSIIKSIHIKSMLNKTFINSIMSNSTAILRYAQRSKRISDSKQKLIIVKCNGIKISMFPIFFFYKKYWSKSFAVVRALTPNQIQSQAKKDRKTFDFLIEFYSCYT